MIIEAIKRPLRHIRNAVRDQQTLRYIAERLRHDDPHKLSEFDFSSFRKDVTRFTDSMRADGGGIRFRYSASCTQPTLYASAYACMIYSMLGESTKFSAERKKEWVEYFNSFQNVDDGLFYDPTVKNHLYDDTDWWGARHLALHMIIAYADLGAKPNRPFHFLRKYKDCEYIAAWLDGFDWGSQNLGDTDIDNKIMNISCLLQFERDTWGDHKAGDAVDYIKRYLLSKINPASGMWGGFDTDDANQRSRLVQFAYHLFPVFFYDGYYDFDIAKIVPTVLKTQNRLGGFGVNLNSSACEDIDSLDILVRFSNDPILSNEDRQAIDRAINRGFSWVMNNQVDDGGFGFRLNEPFVYGHKQMSSYRNEGGLFPTWFRTLSVVLIDSWAGRDRGLLNFGPGYIPPLNGMNK